MSKKVLTASQMIREFRLGAEAILTQEGIEDTKRYNNMVDLYYAARDNKSDGNLHGFSIFEVISYDTQVLDYLLGQCHILRDKAYKFEGGNK